MLQPPDSFGNLISRRNLSAILVDFFMKGFQLADSSTNKYWANDIYIKRGGTDGKDGISFRSINRWVSFPDTTTNKFKLAFTWR